MVYTFEFCVHFISPLPMEGFLSNFGQMFISVRGCAEFMKQLCRLKVKVTVKGHVIYA